MPTSPMVRCSITPPKDWLGIVAILGFWTSAVLTLDLSAWHSGLPGSHPGMTLIVLGAFNLAMAGIVGVGVPYLVRYVQIRRQEQARTLVATPESLTLPVLLLDTQTSWGMVWRGIPSLTVARRDIEAQPAAAADDPLQLQLRLAANRRIKLYLPRDERERRRVLAAIEAG